MALIAVIARFLATHTPPLAIERRPQTEVHANAESYNADPKPWVLELLCLRFDFVTGGGRLGAIIVAVHAWGVHKSFT